jgi:hypothetical protein
VSPAIWDASASASRIPSGPQPAIEPRIAVYDTFNIEDGLAMAREQQQTHLTSLAGVSRTVRQLVDSARRATKSLGDVLDEQVRAATHDHLIEEVRLGLGHEAPLPRSMTFASGCPA